MGRFTGARHRADDAGGTPAAARYPVHGSAEPDEVVDPDAIYEPGGHDHTGPREGNPDHDSSSAPNLARAAVTVIGHTGSWAAGTYLRTGKRMIGVVIAPASGLELVRDMATETTRAIQTVAEVTDLDRRLDAVGPAGALVKRIAQAAGSLLPASPLELTRVSGEMVPHADHNGHAPNLREQGEELLRRSRDVNDAYDAHPAYARILSEIAPDEARILSLMLLDGPQPTVDVRTGGPLGLINSRLIAPGLSMIGARAGCRYVERVPSYLNNLFRLGLIWFSHETLRDHQRYQVLEAQPDVLEAIHAVTQAKVVRRSVHLTPFGEDFCRVCLSDGDADLAQLPEHSAPKELDTEPQPPNETVEP
jgi:hypothetical protein